MKNENIFRGLSDAEVAIPDDEIFEILNPSTIYELVNIKDKKL